MLAKPSFFYSVHFAASIRWLRGVDRPPRRSLSNELLIARGTPPNLGGEFLLQAPHKWPISRPRARARGFLSKRSQPLRGCVPKRHLAPGLRPGLHSVAAPRLNTDAGLSANSLPRWCAD